MKQPKQVITARVDPAVLEFIDYNADRNGESRSTIINHIIKQHMRSIGMRIEEAAITIEDPTARQKGTAMNMSTDIMGKLKR